MAFDCPGSIGSERIRFPIDLDFLQTSYPVLPTRVQPDLFDECLRAVLLDGTASSVPAEFMRN
jgi:hypothetical protein